jgi:hypothetical protein
MKTLIYLLALVFLFGIGEGSGQVVINEVMANVKGSEGGAGAPGDRNEFVEILNISPDTVDVDGWFLDDGDARDVLRAWTDTTINDPDVVMNTTLIPSGAYAVILDPEYPDSGDGNYVQPYDFPSNTIILTIGNTTIGNGLQNNDPLSLFDQDTILIDTYGTPSDTTDTIPFNPGDGVSAERIDSALPDLESNWLPSMDTTGSTPGKENSVSVGVEERGENYEYRTRNVEFRLAQNFPNPFHRTTVVRYQIPNYQSVIASLPAGQAGNEAISVRLEVYDITGRLVETFIDERQKPGNYKFPITSNQLPGSGIYFYRLTTRIGQAGEFATTKKLILLQ